LPSNPQKSATFFVTLPKIRANLSNSTNSVSGLPAYAINPDRLDAPPYVIQPQIMIAPDKKREAEAPPDLDWS